MKGLRGFLHMSKALNASLTLQRLPSMIDPVLFKSLTTSIISLLTVKPIYMAEKLPLMWKFYVGCWKLTFTIAIIIMSFSKKNSLSSIHFVITVQQCSISAYIEEDIIIGDSNKSPYILILV